MIVSSDMAPCPGETPRRPTGKMPVLLTLPAALNRVAVIDRRYRKTGICPTAGPKVALPADPQDFPSYSPEGPP